MEYFNRESCDTIGKKKVEPEQEPKKSKGMRDIFKCKHIKGKKKVVKLRR